MYKEIKQSFLQGDCIRLMQSFPENSVNLILTDPPYLVNYSDRSGRTIENDKNGDWLPTAFKEMYRVLDKNKFCVSFYGWHKIDLFFDAWKEAGFRAVGHLTFPKRYTSKTRYLRYQHESAYLLAKGTPQIPEYVIGDVLDWTYSGNKLHPTQKPLGILIPLIKSFSYFGDVVLDPFAGSGSTCVAAKAMGRNYVGIELDKKYHSLAVNRLNQFSEKIELTD
jgi:adenine-specific DNA-methyltransferase